MLPPDPAEIFNRHPVLMIAKSARVSPCEWLQMMLSSPALLPVYVTSKRARALPRNKKKDNNNETTVLNWTKLSNITDTWFLSVQ